MNLPLDKQYIIGPITCTFVITLIFFTSLNGLFEFDREAINNGSLWLVFVSQFSHGNLAHLLLNGAGVLFVWALHGEYTTPLRYWLNLTFLALLTGTAIYLFAPDIYFYTGLSGVLHGVIIWGALMDVKLGRKDGWLLLLGVIVKLAWEQIFGASESVKELIEANVAVDAHLFGAICGVILFLLVDLKRKPA